MHWPWLSVYRSRQHRSELVFQLPVRHAHTRTHTHEYTHTRTHTHTHAHTLTHTHTHTHTSDTHTNAQTHHTHTNAHTHTHVHTNSQTHAHMHTHYTCNTHTIFMLVCLGTYMDSIIAIGRAARIILLVQGCSIFSAAGGPILWRAICVKTRIISFMKSRDLH